MYKTELGTAAQKHKKQEKIAEAATEAKNTAGALAANLAKELKVKKFIVDSIPELEASWKKEQLTIAEYAHVWLRSTHAL